jgi:hypothetical protein
MVRADYGNESRQARRPDGDVLDRSVAIVMNDYAMLLAAGDIVNRAWPSSQLTAAS